MQIKSWYTVAAWQQKLVSIATITALALMSAGPLVYFAVPSAAFAADTSFKSPAGTESPNEWSNPTNAFSSNDLYATADSDDDDQGYNTFNFAVPSGSTIDGIEVSLEAVSSLDTSLLSESFGTGTDGNIDNWEESGGDTQQWPSSSGNNSASLNGGSFALIDNSNGWICRAVNASGNNNLVLSYYWRGDADAESDDVGTVEYLLSSNAAADCDNASGWTTLETHDMSNDTAWSSHSENLPGALNNSTFLVRFRANASQNGQELRIDGVSVTGTGTAANTSCQVQVRVGDDNDFSSYKTATLTGTESTYTLGGAADLWAETWDADSFTNGNFDLEVRFNDPDANCSSSAVAKLDAVQAKVHYTLPEEPAANPTLANSCGLDVALIIDTSYSINSTELATMKSELNSFVDALVGVVPEAQFSVTRFNDDSAVLQAFTSNITSVHTGINSAANSSDTTNWVVGLNAGNATFDPRPTIPNLIIFVSDGEPREPGGSEAAARQAAVEVANDIKGAGTRIATLGVAVGSGNNQNLIDISSADANFTTTTFDDYAAALDAAASICTGTVNVTKVVNGSEMSPINFSFDVQGGAQDTVFEIDGTNAVTVTPGEFNITENSHPDFTTSYSGCSGTIAAGETKECTITNTYVTPPPPSCDAQLSSLYIVSDGSESVNNGDDTTADDTWQHPAWATGLDADADWIWATPEVASPSQTEVFTFTETFSVTGTPVSASLEIAADNGYSVTLNGEDVCEVDPNGTHYNDIDTCVVDVADIVQGTNTLAVTVTNLGYDTQDPHTNPGGVIYKLTINKNACIPAPTTSTVTMCKDDQSGAPLAGWTLMLKGASVEDLSVLSTDPLGVNTVGSLANGVSYIATAVGTWLNQGGNNPADAEYSTTDIVPATWETQMNGYTGYGDGILELEINQVDGNWGTYNSAHTYAQSFTGTGAAANFRIFDGDTGTHVQNEGWFGDNSGSLSVNVSAGYAGITSENGCVVFEGVPVGEYVAAEIMQDGWTNVSGLGAVTVNDATETFTIVNSNGPQCNPNAQKTYLSSDVEGEVIATTDGSGPASLVTFIHDAWADTMDALWIWIDPTTSADHALNGSTPQTFTRTFTVVGTPLGASLDIAADNGYVAKINGNTVCQNAGEHNYEATTTCAVAANQLVNGVNTLTIEITNLPLVDGTPETNPAGVLYKLTLNEDECVVPPPPAPTSTLSAVKIECDAEEFLPNWGDHDPVTQITATTAAEFLATGDNADHCRIVPWTFEWSLDGVGNPGDEAVAGGAGWNAFAGGTAVIPEGVKVWVREQFDINYIDFTGQNIDQSVSAELYCSTDVRNYDNWEWIDPNVAGNTYHCVGFNVPDQQVDHDCDVETEHWDEVGHMCVPNGGGEEPVASATVSITKVSCDAEQSLPNWGAGTSTITSTTASEFLAANSEHCYVEEGWQFEYATTSPADPEDNGLAALGGAWSLLTTGEGGVATAAIPLAGVARIDVREVLQDGYVPFTGQNTDLSTSAEIYCAEDGVHYDNWEWIENPVDGATYHCVAFNALDDDNNEDNDDGDGDDTPAPQQTILGGGIFGGGAFGGSVLGAATQGQVLGASCSSKYLEKYLRMGKKNDPEQVKLLQTFLNKWENAGLPVTGFFGPMTFAAVMAFQQHYFEEVLKPWGVTMPTGIVYHTTQRWINLIECPELDLTIPPLSEWHEGAEL